MRGVLVILSIIAMHGAALGAPRLAIYPLRAQGASAEALQQLDAALRIELSRVKGLELAGAAPSDAPRDCHGAEVACLCAFGKALKADEVLYGEVLAMPDSYSVTLRLIDVASARETGRTSGSYNRDVEEMVLATRSQVARLKAPERFAGRLLVQAPGKATASVNGSVVKPGEPLVLKPGLHEVHIQAGSQGALDWVEVRFEQEATVKLAGTPPKLVVTWAAWAAPERIEFANVAPPRDPDRVQVDPLLLKPAKPETVPEPQPAPQPPAKPGMAKWPGIVAVVAGAALAGVGTYELVHAGAVVNDLKGLRDSTGEIPASNAVAAHAKYDEYVTSQAAGAACVGVGAAAVVGGALYLLLAPTSSGAQVTVGGKF